MLVAVLPLALFLHLLVKLPPFVDQATFAMGVVAFAVGAFLLLPWEDGHDEREEAAREPGPGPWWPEFERKFRAYAARSTEVRA